MVIFTSKNLKFSELSKNRKLIHLSFIEIQKSPFQEKITFPKGTSQKTKKSPKASKKCSHLDESRHIKSNLPSKNSTRHNFIQPHLFHPLLSQIILFIIAYLMYIVLSLLLLSPSFLFLYVTRYITSSIAANNQL